MEILPHLYRVDGVNGSNCYIIERDGLILVDTGFSRSSRKIISFIEDELKANPKDLKYILLTHYHPDHAGNAAELKRITGAKIGIHEADAVYLAGKEAMPPLKGIKGRIIKHLLHLWPCEPVIPDVLLHENDGICGLYCIHTPGHTPGSASFYDPKLKALFCGDAVIIKNGKADGPPYYATPDMACALDSVGKISQIDFEILLSGHGVPLRPCASEKVLEYCRSLEK